MSKSDLRYKCPRCKLMRKRSDFEGKNGKRTIWCNHCRQQTAEYNPSRKEFHGGKSHNPFSTKKQCHGVPGRPRCKKMIENYRCDECWTIIRSGEQYNNGAYTGEEYGGYAG